MSHLSDTDEKLQAIAESSDRLAILQHEKDCWEKGPVKELRASVQRLESYVKAAILIGGIMSAISTAASLYSKITPTVPQAHAYQVEGK